MSYSSILPTPGHRFASDHRIRQITLLFGFLAMASVLWHQQAPLAHWVLPALFCLGWPYLARELAEQALSPEAAQRRNIVVDMFMGGVMIAIMRFDILPSMLAVLLGGVNAWRHGGRSLLVRGLVLQASGVLLGGLSYGFMWLPHSSSLTIVLSAPLILLHPWLLGGAQEKVGVRLRSDPVSAPSPRLLGKLYEGLEQSGCALGLFDPADRLVLCNALFREWFNVQNETRTFADLMRYCFQHGCGPALGSTQDIDAWLQVAAHRRHGEFSRHFMVDMVDGRCLSALETSFGDGWVLLVLCQADTVAEMAQA